MSFPAFSGLCAIFIAAAAVAPEDIPTCNILYYKDIIVKILVEKPRIQVTTLSRVINLQVDLLSVQHALRFQLLHRSRPTENPRN